MRAFLLGGVAGPVLLALVVILAGLMRPEYSHIHHFISELGATGTPNAAIMNYAGFVPAGLLLAGFGLALPGAISRTPLVLGCAALVVLFGLGIATCGIASCDPGCLQEAGSAENVIHNRIAPASFLCLILAAGILGARFRTLRQWRTLAWYSAASSLLGALLLVALASTLETRHLTGLWQRLLLVVLFSWCAVVGLNAYKSSAPSEGDAPAV